LSGYIQCQVAVLPVKNVGEAIAYYRDMLGFEEAWVWEDGGYAAVRCGAIELHLDLQTSFAAYRAHSYWFVQNADELYSSFKGRGVEIVHELEAKPWGVKEFTFQDLNGHRFRIAQHTEKEALPE
jgi:uncharacterized glyoxalase superfamily protein PhnB